MVVPAICYAIALCCLIWKAREFPAWGVWILLWGSIVATWDPLNKAWGAEVYTPLLVISSMILSIACMEAFFAYGEKLPLAVSTSAALSMIAVAAGWLVLNYYQSGSIILRLSMCVRVGCFAFLLLAIAFWASIGCIQWTRELRHVVTVTLITGSLAAGSVLHTKVGWVYWWNADAALQWGRALLLIAWVIWIPRWRSTDGRSGVLPGIPARENPAASASHR